MLGNFEWVLRRLRAALAQADPELPMMEALRQAMVEANRFEDHQLPTLRIQMSLIARVPDLQAHAMVRFAAWRSEVAAFAAERLGRRPEDLLPQTIAAAALGTAMAAFTHWVRTPDESLERCVDAAFRELATGFVAEPN